MYAALHDPYISALSEVEDEDIFDGLDDEDLNEYDSLFDDSEPAPKVEVLLLKQTTVEGKKIAKDTIVELSQQAAEELIKKGNAKPTDN